MNAPIPKPQPLFVTEGFFLALPPAFPGVSAPPPLEESRLTRLAVCGDGVVFAAAAGPDPLIFQFMPKAPNGYALSWREDGDEVLGMEVLTLGRLDYLALLIRCGQELRLVLRQRVYASEGIQEWWAVLPDFRHELRLGPGSSASLAADGKPGHLLVAAATTLWTVRAEVESGFVIMDRQSHGGGELFRLSPECVVLLDRCGGTFSLLENGVPAPAQALPELRDATAFARANGHMLWATPSGQIHAWSPSHLAPDRLGSMGLAPVTALASLPDGRIFGFAGKEIAHWFCLEPGAKEACDLGVAVSVLSARRYGFEFSAILPGPGGELYCAESDRGGHLWMYLPSTKA
jgi:hypothetical protein